MKENNSTGLTRWLSSWKCFFPMLRVHWRINNKISSCTHIWLMQSVPINNFLAWVRHGHLQKVLWTYIAIFSQIAATEDSWLEYVTISLPLCTWWYLNKIPLTCPRNQWRNCWTLQIGMPHLREPSLRHKVQRKLHMCCGDTPQKI